MKRKQLSKLIKLFKIIPPIDPARNTLARSLSICRIRFEDFSEPGGFVGFWVQDQIFNFYSSVHESYN